MDDRHAERPLRVPVLDRYTDRGTMVLGKVEQVSPCTVLEAVRECVSNVQKRQVLIGFWLWHEVDNSKC